MFANAPVGEELDKDVQHAARLLRLSLLVVTTCANALGTALEEGVRAAPECAHHEQPEHVREPCSHRAVRPSFSLFPFLL